MKLADKFRKGMKGKLQITVIGKDGHVKGDYIWENLITNNGYIAAAECLAGVSGAAITNINFGTNGTAPTLADTAITGAVNIPLKNVTYPEDGSVAFHFLVDWFDGVGVTIAEWGLMTADGRLFSRLTRDVIVKNEEMQLLGRWTINI
jgi:hypothetical protein